MSADRLHARLLEAAAWELDRNLRVMTTGETYRSEMLQDQSGRIEFLARFVDAGVEIGGRFRWAKTLVKRVIRPFLARQAQVDRMIIERLMDLTEAMRQSGSAIQGLREEMREDQDFREQRQKSPMMPGLRRAPGAPAGLAPTRLRVADAGEGVVIPDGARLFLGETPVPKPGYLYVAPDERADVFATLDAIPAKPSSVAEIVVANVLENHSAAEVRAVLMPHWANLLRPGGRLTLIADDFGAAVDRVLDGQNDADSLAEAIFGDGGRARRSAFTPEALRTIVEEAGLVDVRIPMRAQRPESGIYGFEMTATAPAT